jgi:serine/threonine-protein kinase
VSLPPDRHPGREDPAHEGAVDELIGRVLGDRYRVDALVARGGMARVYRAQDLRLDRRVAVKVLSRPYADSADFTRRFLDEARTAASLSHANLVHVYDSGASDGLHYMVMELLEHYRSLRTVLAERGRLPPSEAVRLAREVLAGLEVVHSHGLVHADVKAGNVMIGPGPTKLIDFGIARGPRSVSDDGTSLGSLHAMSPEQLRGEALTPASDVFAVGVVAYQALTGRVPYPGDDPTEVAAEQDARRVPPPSSLAPEVGERLDRVVLQALDPEPAVRFSGAGAMSHALAIAAADPPRQASVHSDQTTQVISLPAPRSPTVGPRRRVVRRRRSGVPMLAGVVIAVLAIAVAFSLSRIDLSFGGGGGGGSGATPSVTAAPTLPAGKVRVPNTIGMSEKDAEAAARQAGLQWEIRWRQVANETPGIYDQQPPAGSVVDAGARFTMYAYRLPD